MNQLSDFIESGILELYVMGAASPEEINEVQQMAAIYPEIKQEIDRIGQSLEDFAMAQAVEPRPMVKPMLLATVDFMERIKNGEPFAMPPLLSPAAKAEDFAEWLNREDFSAPVELDGAFTKLIGANLKVTTAVIWLETMTDYEVHHHEYEHFLILEGTCDFIIGSEVHSLVAGDYIAIPLHVPHIAKVTSSVPCKAIVQRVAA